MPITTKKAYYGIILILGVLTGLVPFSVDMYLPGFPAIAEGLHTSVEVVGISLASFFAGICIGQLIYGPVMDRFGRKKPLLAGLVIYILATVGCAFSDSIEQFIFYRFIQALGGCASMVASRAAVRDLFPLKESAKVFSMLMLIMGVAPIVAPGMGSLMVTSFGWQSIFTTLGVIALLILVSVSIFLPESKAADTSISLNPLKIVSEYGEVLKNRSFLLYTLVCSFASAALFAYISSSPFVFMKLHALNEQQYGLVFSINAFCLIAGSQLNRLLLKRWESALITRRAGIALFFAGLGLCTLTFYHLDTLYVTICFISLCLFLIGIIFPNTTALALAPFSKNAGMAAALSGFFQMAFCALSVICISWMFNGTTAPMAVIIAASSGLSLLCLAAIRFSEKLHPAAGQL